GWKTTDGKRVKQGLLFRTSALDYYSDSEKKMKNSVDAEGLRTLRELGIRTEIDLRVGHDGDPGYPPEGKTESVLGADVNYLHCPILLGPENYLNSVDSLRTIFKTLADPANYPVAYHCAVGADRTGFVSYLLLSLLGVEREDVLRDYLFTNFSEQKMYRPPINRGYVVTVDETPGDTLREKVRRVLTETIGIPEAELDFITAFMTE
ncbi:MAG: tyrosine-protein phosphatase, partial [Clostridia bacterium]|nr:tyrosine-protein phosphatase [Clostridia bacterium]